MPGIRIDTWDGERGGGKGKGKKGGTGKKNAKYNNREKRRSTLKAESKRIQAKPRASKKRSTARSFKTNQPKAKPKRDLRFIRNKPKHTKASQTTEGREFGELLELLNELRN